ncbi:MAG: hypothetical protein J0H55_09190 [Chitinophagaceae bacterium]|nr:hypothetical protein [Chitinophagaceae bacterium]
MKKGLWTLAALSGLFFLTITTGCNSGGNKNGTAPAGPKKDTVLISGMQFQPANITINAGDTILWINKDIVDHNVTDSTKAWTSGDITANGGQWDTVPGNSFHYLCTIHPTMIGSVTVNPKK